MLAFHAKFSSGCRLGIDSHALSSLSCKGGVHKLHRQDEVGGTADFTKGQLISKCPYEKSVWTKYQRKYFQDFCPGSLLLQGYYKTESIFLQTEYRLSFVLTLK